MTTPEVSVTCSILMQSAVVFSDAGSCASCPSVGFLEQNAQAIDQGAHFCTLSRKTASFVQLLVNFSRSREFIKLIQFTSLRFNIDVSTPGGVKMFE